MKWLMKRFCLLLFFLSIGFLASCAKDSAKTGEMKEPIEVASVQAVDDPEFVEKPLHTLTIDSISTSDSLLTFGVTVQTPNPCWKFARYEIEQKNGEIFVTVIGRKKKDEMCIQMIGSFDTTVPVAISESREYTCRFWCPNSTTLDTTITVQ